MIKQDKFEQQIKRIPWYMLECLSLGAILGTFFIAASTPVEGHLFRVYFSLMAIYAHLKIKL